MGKIRPAFHAGHFYPAEPDRLREMIEAFLDEPRSRVAKLASGNPAYIVPHAGYVYSGPVAAYAYALMECDRSDVKRVILIGPSHYADFKGFAFCSASAFETPLGTVPVDQDSVQQLAAQHLGFIYDAAHEPEHCLEVQIPFLQMVLDEFIILPVLVGRAEPSEVSHLFDAIDGQAETVILVSSDLSHYLDYTSAVRLDRSTVSKILQLDWRGINSEAACGHRAIRGIVYHAALKGWRPRLLDLRNSGDTAGPKDQVVGYASVVFEQRRPLA